MASLSTTQSITELDRIVEKLIFFTIKAIDQHTPEMKPSLYAKQWFSPELKL
jgi:hypothetical protein